MSDDGLMDVQQVAARLKVKPSWVYRHADAIGALRLGKYLRFLWPRVLERLAAGAAALLEGPPAGASFPKRSEPNRGKTLQ